MNPRIQKLFTNAESDSFRSLQKQVEISQPTQTPDNNDNRDLTLDAYEQFLRLTIQGYKQSEQITPIDHELSLRLVVQEHKQSEQNGFITSQASLELTSEDRIFGSDVIDRYENAYTPEMKEALKKIGLVSDKVIKFIRYYLNTGVFNPVFKSGKIKREKNDDETVKSIYIFFSIQREIARKDPNRSNESFTKEFSSETDKTIKEEFESLEKEMKIFEDALEEAKREAKDLLDELFKFFDTNKEKYRKFVDSHRLDPDQMIHKHPSNIRVLASTSQLFQAPAPKVGEKKDDYVELGVQWLSEAMKSSTTMDEAIDKVTEKVYVRSGDNPLIQKPVSSPNRANSKAWRKDDNENPNVYRIVILMPFQDGNNKDHSNSADKLEGDNYSEKSVKGYKEKVKKDPNAKNKFRVDKIIRVKLPTTNETWEGNIQKAYEDAGRIARAKKEDGLQVEGIAHWMGHGNYIDEKSPKRGSDLSFWEGSNEFIFQTGLNNKGVTETTIKDWEKKYLGDVSYFIQHIDACFSGSFIA